MSIFNSLLQRFDNNQFPTNVEIVPQRFRQLLREHGVIDSQIPRIFPEVTLDDLKSNETLLKVLTPVFLDKVATRFAVRLEWLEGVDEYIYDIESCFKRPELFLVVFG